MESSLKVGQRDGSADDASRKKIRCPLCAWQPSRHDRWQCTCLHVWNTFDTRALCPRCGYQWLKTQCLMCHRMSLHEAWYADSENPKS